MYGKQIMAQFSVNSPINANGSHKCSLVFPLTFLKSGCAASSILEVNSTEQTAEPMPEATLHTKLIGIKIIQFLFTVWKGYHY